MVPLWAKYKKTITNLKRNYIEVSSKGVLSLKLPTPLGHLSLNHQQWKRDNEGLCSLLLGPFVMGASSDAVCNRQHLYLLPRTCNRSTMVQRVPIHGLMALSCTPAGPLVGILRKVNS